MENIDDYPFVDDHKIASLKTCLFRVFTGLSLLKLAKTLVNLLPVGENA